MADEFSSGAEPPKRHTSRHLRAEVHRLERQINQGDPLWPAQLAVATTIALGLTLSDKLLIGPGWLLPAAEGVMLLTLVVIAPARAGRIKTERERRRRRRLLWTVLGLATLTYLISLGLLVHYLVTGGQSDGRPLISSGMALWATNVLLFSVIYFELDGGGPVHRFQKHPWRDFQFPQMENPQLTPLGERWRPTFLDYLYTSLTNATAFSPTDTMPITQMAKVLMGIQGTAAIATIGLVLARAVNILG